MNSQLLSSRQCRLNHPSLWHGLLNPIKILLILIELPLIAPWNVGCAIASWVTDTRKPNSSETMSNTIAPWERA